MDTINRLRNSNQQPNKDKLYKLLSAGNEQLKKDQLEKRLIKLTENSVLRLKPLNGNKLHYIVDTRSEKIIENIIPDEPDNSNKLE